LLLFINISNIISFSIKVNYDQQQLDIDILPLDVISSSGKYQGFEINGTRTFLGIPFAQPPIESLRFKPPVEPSSFLSINANQWSLACYQTGIKNASLMSEDCLYLNIFTPLVSSDDQQGYPVMVFIHGGRYWTGQSSTFPGDYISSLGNVILVTIQYRLNIFGFQSFNQETNNGLLDQQMALQWVQNNINSFGGNPQNVTIFGESAGGSSVLHHLTIESSYSLYSGAIIESHWMWLIPTLDVSREKTISFAASKGCNNTMPNGQPDYDSILSCMTLLPASSILPATSQSDFFLPMIDNTLINQLPLAAIRDGNWNKNAKIIIGHNYDEGNFMAYSRTGAFQPPTVPVSDSAYYNSLNKCLNVYLNSSQASDIISLYNGVKAEYGNWYGAAEFFGDYYIICGSILAADYLNQQNANLFTYIFNYSSPNFPSDQSFLSSSHGNELPYVFYQPIYTPYTFSQSDFIMADRMLKAWTDFAKTGKVVSDINLWPSSFPNSMYFGPNPMNYSDTRPYLKSICSNLKPYFE